jgi:hypothetical protein
LLLLDNMTMKLSHHHYLSHYCMNQVFFLCQTAGAGRSWVRFAY